MAEQDRNDENIIDDEEEKVFEEHKKDFEWFQITFGLEGEDEDLLEKESDDFQSDLESQTEPGAEGINAQEARELDSKDKLVINYEDVYSTKQQKKRDKKVTDLLGEYVDNYKNKNINVRVYKEEVYHLIYHLIEFGIIGLFCLTLFAVIKIDEITVEGVVALITVYVSILSIFTGLFKIIMNYIFPKNEEKYITRIVEIIQKNDLENKREHIKASASKKAEDQNINE